MSQLKTEKKEVKSTENITVKEEVKPIEDKTESPAKDEKKEDSQEKSKS